MRFDPLPVRCLVDQTLAIRVRGARPGRLIKVSLRNRDGLGNIFSSQATFCANEQGVVDLEKDAPVSGTYSGIDPMGLFWSRVVIGGTNSSDASEVPEDPLTAILTATSDDEISATHSIRRTYLSPGLQRQDVRAQGLVGALFSHEGVGQRPAVMVLGGSDGGLQGSLHTAALHTAALLASHGFSAFALAYFAEEGLPATLDRIPLEYFEGALQWLMRQPSVSGQQVGVLGYSRGGELALQLGVDFPALKAVVAYVPSGVRWGSYPPTGHSAWTRHGEELSFAETKDDEAAQIAVENINGPVLLISGKKDGLWPSAELAEIAVRRLKANNFSHTVQHLSYDDAGHALAWPNGPTSQLNFIHPTSGDELSFGGTPEGRARAQSDSWPKMLSFLKSALSVDAGVAA